MFRVWNQPSEIFYELTKWDDNWKLRSLFIHYATSPAREPTGEVNIKNLGLM